MELISQMGSQAPCHPWKGLSTWDPVQASHSENKNSYSHGSYALSTAQFCASSESDSRKLIYN